MQATETKAPRTVNGVNVDQLFGTIDAIKDKAEIAKFNFRAKNQWVNGAHNRTTIDDFSGACQVHKRQQPFVCDASEHPVLLGEDQGPNPVEYALKALAGCLTTALVYHAAARGIELDAVESTLEGDLDLHGFLGMDDSVRNGYEAVRVKFNIKGDISDETKAELCELAQKRSPVFDIISHAVPVKVTLDSN
jgi:uncharacterized OsmC-like protein